MSGINKKRKHQISFYRKKKKKANPKNIESKQKQKIKGKCVCCGGREKSKQNLTTLP